MWGRSVGKIDGLKEARTELIQAAKRSDRWEHFKIAGPANVEGLAREAAEVYAASLIRCSLGVPV